MNIKKLCIAAALGLTGASASAALVITEAMNNSSHGGGPSNGDWWELTNTGASGVNLNGYYWDDDGPSGNDGALFPNIIIAAGESIVIVDENSGNVSDFVTDWGGGFTAYSKDDFSGPDDFSGLSAGGDQIQLWDADPNAGPANLVAEVLDTGDQSAPNAGRTFAWDTAGNSLGRSSDGVNGAFIAPLDDGSAPGSDIGSPGVAIPEPGTSAMVVLAGLAAVIGLRRRS